MWAGASSVVDHRGSLKVAHRFPANSGDVTDPITLSHANEPRLFTPVPWLARVESPSTAVRERAGQRSGATIVVVLCLVGGGATVAPFPSRASAFWATHTTHQELESDTGVTVRRS
jgi:hypothetical protein